MVRTALIPLQLSILILLIPSCGKDSPTGSDNPSNGAAKTFAITGRILESGSGLSGVSVRLAGAGKDTTATTNSTGSYTFIGLPDGSYSLTPTKTDYTFNPQSFTVSVNGANFVAPDITASKSTVPIPKEITFVTIPGGTFQMGNVENAPEGNSDEKPVHTVSVSGFSMSRHEITNAQYAMYLNAALKNGEIYVQNAFVMGAPWGQLYNQGYLSMGFGAGQNKCWITYNGETFSVTPGYDNWPVITVTWYGAKAFAEFYKYDLPTEAEWEYACRGGKQYKYATSDGTISSVKANYYWGSGYISHPVEVGSYPANPFGLHDMCGNLFEWCNDFYSAYSSANESNPMGPSSGYTRVLRGGSFGDHDNYCRSASRYFIKPDYMDNYIGFRVVRRLSP